MSALTPVSHLYLEEMPPNDLTKRLPAELLAMIFEAWKYSYDSNQHGLAAEWVRATWVCQTWRQVALDTAALWSSILVSRRLVDDPMLELQLDRAHGIALDLSVSCPQTSNKDLEEVVNFVLSRTKAIKQLRVTFDSSTQQTVVKRFLQDVGIEVVVLSLHSVRENLTNNSEWDFSPDAFPRLHHLKLHRIVPTTRAPLTTLIHLDIKYATDDSQLMGSTPEEDLRLCTRLHRFLAACPNLESLRWEFSAFYPAQYSEHQPLIIPLPRLRYLSLEDTIFEIAETLRSLRLQPSASFHIITECEGKADGDITLEILPQNVSEVLPLVRHTRCLSLTVGQPTTHISFRGSVGNTFEEGPDWSITIPDLTFDPSVNPGTYPDFPDLEEARFHVLGVNGQQFLAHIPHFLVPSCLVELQLHFAHGLPATRNWVRFFATMPHLRILGIGSSDLITTVLDAFRAHPSLCDELQHLALCVGAAENEGLTVFLKKMVGGWARERMRAGMGLRLLAVKIAKGGDGSDPHTLGGEGDGGCGSSDAEPVGFAATLQEGLFALLEDSVGEVVVETTDCGVCGMDYGLPVNPDEDNDEDDKDEENDEDDEDGEDEDDAGSDEDSEGEYFY